MSDLTAIQQHCINQLRVAAEALSNLIDPDENFDYDEPDTTWYPISQAADAIKELKQDIKNVEDKIRAIP